MSWQKPIFVCVITGAAVGFVGGGLAAAWTHIMDPLNPALLGEPVCVVGYRACLGAAVGLAVGALVGAAFTLVAAVLRAVAGRRR